MSGKNESKTRLTTIGLIVNPIAGMGGAVGLKGTDGKAVLEKAISLGANPIAPNRAASFMSELNPGEEGIRIFVGAGKMGEEVVKKGGFQHAAFGKKKHETTSEDTKAIARKMVEEDVDLLVFCGGDGTARNILEAIGTNIPVLGVPTGVKMHSSVFAVTSKAAATIALKFVRGELLLGETEVMDVDEKAFRAGFVSAQLYGYAISPYEPHLIQGAKMSSPKTELEIRNQAAIALYVIENMKTDVNYIIGPGTTTRTIGDLLDAKKTLLGVDIFCNKKMVAKDVNEKQILEKIRGKPAKIIVTPIGGQGFVFGRGNQQISPRVIRAVGLENIVVVATENKLRSLKSLRVDTGDQNLDFEIRARNLGVITNYGIEGPMQVD